MVYSTGLLLLTPAEDIARWWKEYFEDLLLLTRVLHRKQSLWMRWMTRTSLGAKSLRQLKSFLTARPQGRKFGKTRHKQTTWKLFPKTSALSSKSDIMCQMSDDTCKRDVSLELSDWNHTNTTSSSPFLSFEAKDKMLAKLGLRVLCCTSKPQ